MASLLKQLTQALLLVLSVLLCSFTLRAQVLHVFDINTLSGIENVAIFSKNKSFSGLTDARGQIKLPSDLADTVILNLQHTSYYSEQYSVGKIRENNYHIPLVSKVIILDEHVISPGKNTEPLDKVPNYVGIIYPKEVQFRNPQNSADMLEGTGSVYVQRSQMGGGSPVIRGFEANKILIVVDGVRMNNAIYRSGHLQNVITIDPSMLARTEIVFGPGSLIYGSDALGGVMHFFSKKPRLSVNDSTNVNVNAFVRTASANNENAGHVDFNIGFKKVASLSSVSFNRFGDLRVGSRRSSAFPDFGKRLFYVTRQNGRDSMQLNDDPNRMRFTGYEQLDVLQKVLYAPQENMEFILNMQYSTSSNVPRFDRLNEYKDDSLKYAEWHYGPQERFFSSINFKLQDTKAFDAISVVLAFQQIAEDRIDRKFNDLIRRIREEQVNVYTINMDFVKSINALHELQFGAEGAYNDVTSSGSTFNIETNEIGKTSSRYPDGNNSMQTYASYLTHKWNVNEDVVISEGIRFSQIMLNSTFVDTSFFNFPFSEISLNTSSLIGSIGLSFPLNEALRMKVVAASGFRAPNIDDVGKVFDSNPGNVVVPNPNLKPEYAYSGEISILQNFYDEFRINVTGFYTYLDNAIVRDDFSFNGADSIMYDGQLSRVQANVNLGKAAISGFTVSIISEITRTLSLSTSFNATQGKNLLTNAPLGHIPPLYGMLSVTYQYEKLKVEAFGRYNAWKRIANFSLAEDNADEATRLGSPSWYTVNFRASYQLNKYLRAQLALENILDLHYKPFSSGISAPGRNLIVAIRGNF